MLNKTTQSGLGPTNLLHNVPIDDLQEVVSRALAIQLAEHQRLEHAQSKVQSDEQLRSAVINTARELGVTEHYLRAAADQVLRQRAAEMEARRSRARKIRQRTRSAAFWASFALGVWWSGRHLGLWPTVAGVALFAFAYYYKWRFIDLNNMRQYMPVQPLVTVEEYLDYANGKRR